MPRGAYAKATHTTTQKHVSIRPGVYSDTFMDPCPPRYYIFIDLVSIVIALTSLRRFSAMASVALLYYVLPVFLVLALWLRTRRPQYPFPPGPKPRPCIGNMLDLPVDSPAEKYRDWAREYSEYQSWMSALQNVENRVIQIQTSSICIFLYGRQLSSAL